MELSPKVAHAMPATLPAHLVGFLNTSNVPFNDHCATLSAWEKTPRANPTHPGPADSASALRRPPTSRGGAGVDIRTARPHCPAMKSWFCLLPLLALMLGGCQSMEYAVKEKFGIHKRDILVARVGDAREAQGEARQEFKSALEQFIALTGTGGGALQEKYDKLSSAYERSEGRATAVRERIDEVETVARALFSEWKSELGQYSDPELRRLSEQEIAATQRRYQALIVVMKQAAARMDPVLAKFKDQVLFLKHNLNAQVVARLGNTNAQLQGDITRLIADMERSIQEADDFLREMKTAGGA